MTAKAGAALAAALLCAACDQTNPRSCPSGATLLGNFAVTYAAKAGSTDSCVAAFPDGGVTDAGITTTPAPDVVTLCGGLASDGGVQLYLGASGNTLTPSATDAGTFNTTGSVQAVNGTICSCAVDVAEAVSFVPVVADGGALVPAADAGVTDGGQWPYVQSIGGGLDYTFTASAASNGLSCTCGLPCGAHYTFAGTR
jgi:hypothetical protein